MSRTVRSGLEVSPVDLAAGYHGEKELRVKGEELRAKGSHLYSLLLTLDPPRTRNRTRTRELVEMTAVGVAHIDAAVGEVL